MKYKCEKANTAKETLKKSPLGLMQQKTRMGERRGNSSFQVILKKDGCSGLFTTAIKRPADQNFSINTPESKFEAKTEIFTG